MQILDEIVEARIQEAIERGDFDNLPDAGRPLNVEEDAFIPEEMRLAYKILKNAGYIPPEIELHKNIACVKSELDISADDESRRRNLKKLQCLFMKMDESRHRQATMVLQQEYYEKLLQRF